tara:strand:- start:691 stop:1398 length:708 start_codon:yes stop_codon:yes gene_type:complete
MINFFSFNFVFSLIEKLIKFINSIFFLLLIIALTFALFLSPPDYLQGDSVRIMYIHVPSAWLGLACYTAMAIFSFFYFIFKIKNLILINKSIAPIGFLFTCLAIITGSLWGKPTWGAWWVWDARLTSMIILLIFYFSYIFSFKFIKNEMLATKVASLLAIFGAINVPIIKYSVDWWNTLHQPASIKITGSSAIHPSMLLPLILMLIVLLLYCALIFLMKYKTEVIRIKKKNIKRL